MVSNAGLLLIGYGFDAASGFHFILNVLGFLCVIRYGEEWWYMNKQKNFPQSHFEICARESNPQPPVPTALYWPVNDFKIPVGIF